MSWREKFSNLDFGLRVFWIACLVCTAISAFVFSHGSAEVWHVIEARFWMRAKPDMPLWSSAHNTPAIEIVRNARPEIWSAATRTIWLSPAVGLFCAFVFIVLFNIRGGSGGGQAKDKHLRGARFMPAWRLRVRLMIERVIRVAQGRTPRDQKQIQLAGVPVPYQNEPVHFLVGGVTGVGKSQLITSMMEIIRARGERAIVFDIGGNLMSVMAERGDVLLYPPDARSKRWSLLAEIREPADARTIANALIQPREGESGDWREFSQTLLSVILQKCQAEKSTNAELLRRVATASADELALLAAGTPAARAFEPGADRAKASVLFTMGLLSRGLEYLHPVAGVDSFSIRNWIENETNRGWLWAPYLENHAAELRPLLSTIVDTTIVSVLSLRPDPSRRIWLIMDECDSLGRLSKFEDALTKGRKFGLCVVAGLQDIAQARKNYGRDSAQTILSNLRNLICFNATDPETAEYMSKRLGDAEFARREESKGDRGSSVSERRTVQRIVLPGEIENLPDLTAFLNLAGDYPVTKIRIPYRARPERLKPFVPRKEAAPVSVNCASANVDPLSHLLDKSHSPPKDG